MTVNSALPTALFNVCCWKKYSMKMLSFLKKFFTWVHNSILKLNQVQHSICEHTLTKNFKYHYNKCSSIFYQINWTVTQFCSKTVSVYSKLQLKTILELYLNKTDLFPKKSTHLSFATLIVKIVILNIKLW